MERRKKISREGSGKRIDWTFEFQGMLKFPSGNIQKVTGNAGKKVKTSPGVRIWLLFRKEGSLTARKGMPFPW